MRVFVTVCLCVVAACGRVDFVPVGTLRTDGGADGGAAADTPVGQACVSDNECGRCARCDGTCQVEPVVDVFLGHRQTCYVGSGGTRWCAGQNDLAQLGLGDKVDRATPTRIADGDGWERIFMNFYGVSTGVRANQFWEWGNDTQLTPIAVGPSRDVKAFLGDLMPRCAWEIDGTSTCPGSGAIVWKSLDFGADHTCGVKLDGTLWCWGTSFDDDLGAVLANGTMVSAPMQVGTSMQWVQVGSGGNNIGGFGSTCALDTAAQIWCWGAPTLTATNGVDVGSTPTKINSDTDWQWIDVDWEHACAGKTDGSVWCWGSDTYGGYVAPGMTQALVPVQIAGVWDRWIMGGHHACGQTAGDGRWHCQGWNAFGQLANGITTGTGEVVDLCP